MGLSGYLTSPAVFSDNIKLGATLVSLKKDVGIHGHTRFVFCFHVVLKDIEKDYGIDYPLLNYLKPYLAWVVLGLTQVVFEFGQEVISDVSDCFGSVTGHRHLGAVRQDDVYGVVRLRAHGLGHRCGWRCRGVESLTTSFELNQVDQGKDLEPILGDALVEKEKNVEVQILETTKVYNKDWLTSFSSRLGISYSTTPSVSAKKRPKLSKLEDVSRGWRSSRVYIQHIWPENNKKKHFKRHSNLSKAMASIGEFGPPVKHLLPRIH